MARWKISIEQHFECYIRADSKEEAIELAAMSEDWVETKETQYIVEPAKSE